MKNDFVSLLVSLALIAAGSGMLWKASEWKQKSDATPSWNVVPARITRSEFVDWEKDRADIEYCYEVDGKRYFNERLYIGMGSEGTVRVGKKRKNAAWLLGDFPMGKTVDAYVNPTDPKEAVLLPTAESNAHVLRNFGIGFAGSGALFILTTVKKMFGDAEPEQSLAREHREAVGV